MLGELEAQEAHRLARRVGGFGERKTATRGHVQICRDMFNDAQEIMIDGRVGVGLTSTVLVLHQTMLSVSPSIFLN